MSGKDHNQPNHTDPLFLFSQSLDGQHDPSISPDDGTQGTASTGAGGFADSSAFADECRKLEQVDEWVTAWGAVTPDVDSDVFRELVLAQSGNEGMTSDEEAKLSAWLEARSDESITVDGPEFRAGVLSRLEADDGMGRRATDGRRQTGVPRRILRVGIPFAAAAAIVFGFVMAYQANFFGGVAPTGANVIVYAGAEPAAVDMAESVATSLGRGNRVSYVMNDDRSGVDRRVSIVTVSTHRGVQEEVPPL
ncbi:MAG: hypothetical protein ACPGXK_06465 [Phycisphaerae bacterium]